MARENGTGTSDYTAERLEEFAARRVNINAVAQNYVSNPAYFPDALVASARFQKHLERNVPVRRVAEARESAELALFLASDKSNFIVGQVIPFAGGWATIGTP